MKELEDKNIMFNGSLNLGVELAGGILSRPVPPKLAHEAVLAKPPYFDGISCSTALQSVGMKGEVLKLERAGRQKHYAQRLSNLSEWLSKMERMVNGGW